MKKTFQFRRREFLGVGLAAAGGALCTRATAQQKMSKDQAKYQDKPKGDQRCDGCNFFVAPDGCKLVDGKISPAGWCVLWVAKGK